MKGDNFTKEYKYPIKIYRIGNAIEFANGLELRKLVFSLVLAGIMIITFIVAGITSDANIIQFVLKNWLVMITLIPASITFIVFNMKYDNKGVIPYIKDRYRYYRTRNIEIEHFQEVPTSQLHKDLEFESYMVEDYKEGGKHE